MAAPEEKDMIQLQHLETGTPVESGNGTATNQQLVNTEAMTLVSEVPKGYFRSPLFLGTYFAVAISLVAGSGSYAYIGGLLATINADIGPSTNYAWMGYAYTLCSACTFCLVGRFSDLFGRRWVIIGGTVLGLVGAIIGSQAKTIPVVIAAMAIQGVASSTQIAFQFVMGELVPIGRRFIVMATMFAWSILGGGIGIAIGLMFSTHTSVGWRGAFYYLIGLDVAALTLLVFFYFPPSFHDLEKRKTKMQVLKEFDFVGLFLFISGFCLFLISISFGGNTYPWKSSQVIALLVVGICLLGVFIVWEWNANLSAPFIPFYLFRNLRWVAMSIVLGIGALQFYAMALVWPQMVRALWPATGDRYAWIATVPSLCLLIGQTTGGVLSNFMPPRLVVVTGTVVGTALLGGCACAREDNFYTVLPLAVVGYFLIGFQEAVGGTYITILLHDQNDIGTGGGVGATIRSGMSALGSAVLGSVLQNTLSSNVPKYVTSAATSAGLPASSVAQLILVIKGTAKSSTVPGLTPEILDVATHAYRTAASIAFRNVMLTAMAFGTIGIACSFFAPSMDESKKAIIARTLHRRGLVEHDNKDKK
ncbi:hypothetical protein SBRCBS47491_001793 [Sporothrix bragantina]|uniref:Major facilitator superfamily (MFS) profile domain-containing protein n=1 Tax=Sporothrix bragantina TaxID=671064 RepID=A0ABP0B1P0_9PEZI